MNAKLVFAAVLTGLLAIGSTVHARADEWCGYAAHANAMIECGYSSLTECTSTIGAGATCFVDPDVATNLNHVRLATPAPAISPKPNNG